MYVPKALQVQWALVVSGKKDFLDQIKVPVPGKRDPGDG